MKNLNQNTHSTPHSLRWIGVRTVDCFANNNQGDPLRSPFVRSCCWRMSRNNNNNHSHAHFNKPSRIRLLVKTWWQSSTINIATMQIWIVEGHIGLERLWKLSSINENRGSKSFQQQCEFLIQYCCALFAKGHKMKRRRRSRFCNSNANTW
jgi:hypothetical protein